MILTRYQFSWLIWIKCYYIKVKLFFSLNLRRYCETEDWIEESFTWVSRKFIQASWPLFRQNLCGYETGIGTDYNAKV